MSVNLITDSSAGISKDLQKELGIRVASNTINTFDGEYIDSEVDLDWFYSQYLTSTETLPTSSQPSVDSIQKLFRAAAKKGEDALAISVSEKLSGTIQSMRIAGEMVAQEFAGWKHAVIDSCSTSYQEAFAVLAAARVAKKGGTLQECEEAVEYTKARTRFIFVPETLENLRKGGRIGRVSALLGSALQISPLLGVLDGEPHVFKKVRTRTKALESLMRMFLSDIEKHGLKDIVVHYIGTYADGEAFAKEYVEPILGRAVPVYPVSPVVGVHVGPAVGMVYMTDSPL